MRYVLPFVSLIQNIEFALNIQGNTPTVLCSILKKVTIHKYNKGAIALAFDPHMRPSTNHIVIKYHHFRSFVANCDVEIQHIYTKEQIADIFTKLIDSELF